MDGAPVDKAKQRQALRRGALLGALVVLFAVGIAYRVINGRQPQAGIEQGNAAPGFKLPRYNGGTVSLGDLRGKVVMLNFWATWCVPCAAEMPLLTRLARDYESKGFVFLAVNEDEPRTARGQVDVFVAQVAPDLGKSVVFADEPTTLNYAVEDLPTTYLIGRDGSILESHTGYRPESLLRREVENALGK